jgi:hypothetical protein
VGHQVAYEKCMVLGWPPATFVLWVWVGKCDEIGWVLICLVLCVIQIVIQQMHIQRA